jgi:sarcosine oxidase gamma subunit
MPLGYSEEVNPATATLTVSRTAPNDVRVRQIYISIDGQSVAELLYGQSFSTDLAPGSHRLRANNTLVWTTVDLDLKPGEHARFNVVNRPGFGTFTMLTLLGGGPIYLTFERTDA